MHALWKIILRSTTGWGIFRVTFLRICRLTGKSFMYVKKSLTLRGKEKRQWSISRKSADDMNLRIARQRTISYLWNVFHFSEAIAYLMVLNKYHTILPVALIITWSLFGNGVSFIIDCYWKSLMSLLTLPRQLSTDALPEILLSASLPKYCRYCCFSAAVNVSKNCCRMQAQLLASVPFCHSNCVTDQ